MKKYLFFSLVLAVLATAFVDGPRYDLRGKVTDDNGVALIGATVAIKGTSVATVSAADGTFVLKNVTGNETIVVSFVGCKTKERKIRGRKRVTVELSPETEVQEVVVTAFGMSGGGALAGRARGVQVSGSAPAASRVVLRGATSIYGYHSPSNIMHDQAPVVYNREGYDAIAFNPFKLAKDNPLSTFSIDVDAASYSNVRRFINDGQWPAAGAVRVEEMINYFRYDYATPKGDVPFSVDMEVADCPWNRSHQLVRIGLQGKRIPNESLAPSNLVFLIDVSGSMQSQDKLPLVQSSLKLLTEQLRTQDKVSIVVYAGNAGLVLPSTSGNAKMKILSAINALEAGGSTAGGQGIQLAYKIAREQLIPGGNNRVILCTDGDFNVGVSSDAALVSLIEEERKSGVYLTVLGFGTGNYQDGKMQQLANKGNGNHAYIDNIAEARKVLVQEAGGTLYAIANDVKLQVEFNPSVVQGYRLIGYENRLLAKEDFDDDTKDAGELGSGHTVTALYEVIPAGLKTDLLKQTDTLRYSQSEVGFSEASFNYELMFLKLRYKAPGAEKSHMVAFPLSNDRYAWEQASADFRFAASVAAFGQVLSNNKYIGKTSLSEIAAWASEAKGKDMEGYRAEFVTMVEKAAKLKR